MSEGRKSGRPPKPINWAEVDRMLEGFSPGTEVAACLGIHSDTLYNACVREKGVDFTTYSAEKRRKGEESLRALQLKHAKTSFAMSIWLGKQYLQQREPSEKAQAEFTEEQVALIKSIFAEIAKLQAAKLPPPEKPEDSK